MWPCKLQSREILHSVTSSLGCLCCCIYVCYYLSSCEHFFYQLEVVGKINNYHNHCCSLVLLHNIACLLEIVNTIVPLHLSYCQRIGKSATVNSGHPEIGTKTESIFLTDAYARCPLFVSASENVARKCMTEIAFKPKAGRCRTRYKI